MAKGLKRYTETFGSKAEVNPVHFTIGTASAWGGLPDTAAQYINVQPDLPVGEYEFTVKDIPVEVSGRSASTTQRVTFSRTTSTPTVSTT